MRWFKNKNGSMFDGLVYTSYIVGVDENDEISFHYIDGTVKKSKDNFLSNGFGESPKPEDIWKEISYIEAVQLLQCITSNKGKSYKWYGKKKSDILEGKSYKWYGKKKSDILDGENEMFGGGYLVRLDDDKASYVHSSGDVEDADNIVYDDLRYWEEVSDERAKFLLNENKNFNFDLLEKYWGVGTRSTANVMDTEPSPEPSIVYRHLRFDDREVYLNKGGITIAFKLDKELSRFKFSVAVCSLNENFDKNVGRVIARIRLEIDKCFTMTYDETKTFTQNLYAAMINDNVFIQNKKDEKLFNKFSEMYWMM